MFVGPKCLNLGILARTFRKQFSNLKSAPLKQGTDKILLRLEIWHMRDFANI